MGTKNPGKAKKPNVIICNCDQLRAFELGCYGNDVIKTPNIDNLATEGVRFETASTNCPSCLPARSVILSGQYNRTCTGGVIGSLQYPVFGRLHLKDPTLPELLRNSGYHTEAIGKWHIHSWPNEIGFNKYLIPRVYHCHTGQIYTENGGPEFVAPGYSIDFEAVRVESFLKERSRNKQQPFFLYYSIPIPHSPLDDAPEKYKKMYGPDIIPVRPNVDLDTHINVKDYWFRVYLWDFRYYYLHLPYTERPIDNFKLRDSIALYYGMTTWVDDTVGRMLDVLKETGQEENTIIIFTSDHGDNLGSHGLVMKQTPEEESIRIPFLMRWPAQIKDSTVIREQIASQVDIAPTILSMVGLPVPGHMQGQNLSPVIYGQTRTLEQNHAFIETLIPPGIAIRTLTHMYSLEFSIESGELNKNPDKFYELTVDPYELNNLVESENSAEIGKKLDKYIRSWDKKTPWMSGTKLLKNDRYLVAKNILDLL